MVRTGSGGHKGVSGVAAMRGLARLESTPIVGERGLLLNLSPITSRPSLDDSAVLDNKENHLVRLLAVEGFNKGNCKTSEVINTLYIALACPYRSALITTLSKVGIMSVVGTSFIVSHKSTCIYIHFDL